MCPSAVNCCTPVSEYEAVAGTEDGSLWILDTRLPRLERNCFSTFGRVIIIKSDLTFDALDEFCNVELFGLISD